jgi:Cu/Ag efflux protein CusF
MTRRALNLVCSRLFTIALCQTAASRTLNAGPVPRISHTLHGTVVAVDTTSSSLTVQARRLEAWMSGITGVWRVDNPKVLRDVKPGDQIMAKLFENETALHNVEIVAISFRSHQEPPA